MDKKLIIVSLVAVILIGAAFYGGMAYGKSQRPAMFARNGQGGQFGNFARGGARGAGGGFTAGEVLSKDAGSLTIKLPNGSSMIVLTSSSTAVMKAATGTIADVQVGSNVAVQGSANSDGSLSAQSIQLRPAGAPVPDQNR